MSAEINHSNAIVIQSRTDASRRVGMSDAQLDDFGVSVVSRENPPQVRCRACATVWNPDERPTGQLFICPNANTH